MSSTHRYNPTLGAAPPRTAAVLSAALLDTVEERVPVSHIDELWVFPTFRIADTESTVAVLTVFDADPQRRRVLTAHLTSRREGKQPPSRTATVHENGIVPASRVGQLLDGVLRRLSDELAGTPVAHEIHGDPQRWAALRAATPPPDAAL